MCVCVCVCVCVRACVWVRARAHVFMFMFSKHLNLYLMINIFKILTYIQTYQISLNYKFILNKFNYKPFDTPPRDGLV